MVKLSIKLEQRLEQKIDFSQVQKATLKQLLMLGQSLVHPEYPNMSKGLGGMLKAHEILKEKNSVGILIGGLSEAVWNKQRSQEELSSHKDVDVLVYNLNSNISYLEGGIDWWLPREEKINIPSRTGYNYGVKTKWYKNVGDIILSFDVKKIYFPVTRFQLPSGLYIPDPTWIGDMRFSEVSAKIDYDVVKVDIDDEVIDKFKEHIGKRIKTTLPKYICDSFKGYIMSIDYETNFMVSHAFEVADLNLNIIRGINLFEEDSSKRE